MTEYTGIIEILSVENIGTHQPENETVVFVEMKDKNVRFVHYPDCQQLIIMLPNFGYDYGKWRLLNSTDNSVIEELQVSNRLNGTTQILWDTLPLAPGAYTTEMNWKNGYQHRVSFVKREEGYLAVKKESVTPVAANQKEREPIVYQSGYGTVLPNDDLAIAAKLQQDMVNRFTRRLEYDGNFRAGNVTYVDGDTRIKFSHEMGGGNCMFFVFIPTEEKWEKQTNTPLSQRDSILQFLAQTLQKEQASKSRFEIDYNQITFYFH